MKKEKRNEELIERHTKYPQWSYSDLGWYFRISKQRVGIIHRDTPHIHQKYDEKPHSRNLTVLLRKPYQSIKSGLKNLLVHFKKVIDAEYLR